MTVDSRSFGCGRFGSSVAGAGAADDGERAKQEAKPLPRGLLPTNREGQQRNDSLGRLDPGTDNGIVWSYCVMACPHVSESRPCDTLGTTGCLVRVPRVLLELRVRSQLNVRNRHQHAVRLRKS